MSTSIPKTAVHDLETTKMPTIQDTTETAAEALHAAEDLVKVAGTTIAHDLHFARG